MAARLGAAHWMAPVLACGHGFKRTPPAPQIGLTATGYCSQRLATDFGIDAPTAQSFANYALLSLHGIPLALRRWRRARTAGHAEAEDEDTESLVAGSRLHPWQWLLLALSDVEANYFLVLAYQYTDITSVSLLDAFSVPAVMLFSRLLFRTRYSPRQLLAVAICLSGLVVLVVSDAVFRTRHSADALPQSPSLPPAAAPSAFALVASLPPALPPAPPPLAGASLAPSTRLVLLGDGLVLLGAVLYAASNVWQVPRGCRAGAVRVPHGCRAGARLVPCGCRAGAARVPRGCRAGAARVPCGCRTRGVHAACSVHVHVHAACTCMHIPHGRSTTRTRTWQEHQVRATDATEYLANLGFYGALVSGVQCAVLERPALQRAAAAVRAASAAGRAGELLALEAGFIAALCCMYIIATRLFAAGSSATVTKPSRRTVYPLASPCSP